MDTTFMNSENSRTFKPHVLILNLTDKIALRRGEKSVALSSISIYYTWKNMKSSYNNNKFKISTLTWNDEFEIPDGSYLMSHIQGYFKSVLKQHGENNNNPSIRIYVNKIENRIKFKIKDRILS